MCGRYATTMSTGELQLEFRFDVVAESYLPSPSWNVAPTQDIPIVVERKAITGYQWVHDAVGAPSSPPGTTPEGGRRVRALTPASWGLIPSWAKDASRPMINSRLETLGEKRSFAPSLESRRCIIPASGYFEWRKADKCPFYIYRSDGRPLAFAGLYSWWKAGTDWVLTATIVTRRAQGELANVHDRTPALLEREEYDAWLSAEVGKEVLDRLERPQAPLSFHPVTRAVGNARNNEPENIEPVNATSD